MKSTAFKLPKEVEKTMEEMPAISPIFNKLTAMARDMNTEPIELVRLIMIDPVLSGKVMRLVNSSYYGFKQEIQTLTEAVIIIGVNTIKNLAMYTAVLDQLFLNQKAPLDTKEFWYHCLGTAVGCKMLAKDQWVNDRDLEIYFLAGLLHDLGKVLYIKAVPEAYKRVLIESEDHGTSLALMEQMHFGLSHAQLGGILAKKWTLDPLLTKAIEEHHSTGVSRLENGMLKLVILSNNLCKQAGIGQSGNTVLDQSMGKLVQSLDINPSSLNSTLEQLPGEIEKTVEFLNLKK